MSFYKHEADKKSGDGLALTEWNDLSNAVAGNSGLTLAMTVTDKIGIGTSKPTHKFHVNGNAQIQNVFIGDVGHGKTWAGFAHSERANTLDYGLLTSKDGKHTLVNKKNTGNGFIGFRVGNSDKMVVTNDGNVGIGHANPQATLDVTRGTAPSGTAVFRGTQRISHINYSTDEHTYIRGGKNASNVFINDNGGNVGIGSTSVSEKLTVNGNVKATKFIGDGSGLTNVSVGKTGLILATSSGSKVGIGTDSPTDKLQIGGFQAGDWYLSVTTAGGNRYKAGIKLLAWKKDYGFVVEHDETKNGLNVHFHNPYGNNSKNNILFLSSSSGNVGIGTPTPALPLTVQADSNGDCMRLYATKHPSYYSGYGEHPFWDIHISKGTNEGDTFPELEFKLNGTSKAYIDNDGTWKKSSDSRLKTSIGPLGNVLEKVCALTPSTYHFKDSSINGPKSIGFIAQEVEKIFPELVKKREEGQMRSLGYDNFAVLAIAAIKELKEKFDSLQKQILILNKSLHATD